MMVCDATDVYTFGQATTFVTANASSAVMDGGATTMMGGSKTIRGYLRQLSEKGFDVHKLDFYKCYRPFRFGNGSVQAAKWCVYLPVAFKDKVGLVLTYIVPGKTPLLFPRPLMEMFHLVINYADKSVTWGDNPAEQAVVGHQGHYMVDLLEHGERWRGLAPSTSQISVSSRLTSRLLSIHPSR